MSTHTDISHSCLLLLPSDAQLGKKPAGQKKMTKAELAALAEMDAKAGNPSPVLTFMVRVSLPLVSHSSIQQDVRSTSIPSIK